MIDMNSRIEKIKKTHGQDCFKQWGRKGAEKFWEKYILIPSGINTFAIVEKQSGKFINWLNGISPNYL
jgi:hypothetical protein